MLRPALRQLHREEADALQRGDEAALGGLREDLLRVFRSGPRAVVVAGLDPDLLGEEQFAQILLLMGSWLGTPAIQSPAGETVARVERRSGDAQARGTHSDSELNAHTDLHDILALAAVRTAQHGGDSFLISAAELYAAMQQMAPELLEPLYEGYWFGSNPALHSDNPVSVAKVPVFVRCGQQVQCCFNRYFLGIAAQARGEPLPHDLATAVDALQRTAAVLAGKALFKLERGNVLIWHNWSWLHGRTAFAGEEGDVAADRVGRLLLRLWLHSDLIKPLDPRFAQRGPAIDRDHRRAMLEGMQG